MIRFSRIFLPSLLLAFAVPAHAAGLPDTGLDTCYNDSVVDSVPASDPASIAIDTGTHPRQDCRYGRDAAAAAGQLAKTGAGAKGFDYSKIANNGSVLDAGVALGTATTDWACTRDNTTGLTWEVKTATSTDLRYSGHAYAWYNLDPATNGGNAGNTGSNTCGSTLPGNLCNTEAYVTAVNAAGLCNAADWRMPTQRELLTLVYADGSNPSIEPTYFTNTPAGSFWSGSSYALDPARAWNVSFSFGSPYAGLTAFSHLYIRLVRGGQF